MFNTLNTEKLKSLLGYFKIPKLLRFERNCILEKFSVLLLYFKNFQNLIFDKFWIKTLFLFLNLKLLFKT